MTAIEQLRDEIANLHLLADRLARKQPNDEKPKVDLPTLEECEALYHEVRGSAVSFEPWKEGISAVRALCLASRSPSHELVEAADAMRDTLGKPWEFNHGHSNKPPEECPVCQAFRAYDAARSRLAAAQPAEHPESIGGLASRTPASKQGKKALDDMLLVFAKHDDDEEDCWTQPARLGMQYVSDLEWDLETQVRLASHRAEANESLRIMLSNLAAYTGTHFGPDEPLKNYERVRKTLTDKKEPPSPSSERVDGRFVRVLRSALDRIDKMRGELGEAHLDVAAVMEALSAEKAEEPDAPGIAEAPDGTLPCVYCSNENLCVEIRKHPGMLGFSVRCGSAFCGARGPVRPAQMDAVEEWNRAYRWVHPPKGDAPKPASEPTTPPVVKPIKWAASEAQGEPTLEECQSAYWLAHNAHESSDQPVLYAINAVRSLCLSRAPSPSPALAALVKAGDAMREYMVKTAPHHKREDFVCENCALTDAYDRARAALPKEA